MASEIKVDTIVNAGGDNDSGIDLATNDTIKLNIAGAEKARMDSSGNILVAKTSSDGSVAGHELRNGSFAIHTRDNGAPLGVRRIGSGTNDEGNYLFFENATADVGQIGYISTGFFIQGESSHSGFRFGGNQIVPFRDGSDTDTTLDGFLAHEVSTIVPEAINGKKDETQDLGTVKDKDGNVIKENVLETETKKDDGQTWTKTKTEDVYQSIDQSKLVPLLTKALQEAISEIDTLKQKVTALESK